MSTYLYEVYSGCRRVRIVAKSARCIVMSVCLSMNVRVSHRTDSPEIWYWGTFLKICQETPNLIKIGQKLYTSHEDLSPFYCLRRHELAIKAYFYVVDSGMHFNSTLRTHCCILIGTVFTWTRNIVSLYVHSLSCLLYGRITLADILSKNIVGRCLK